MADSLPRVVPLGDQAALTYWPDEPAARAFAGRVRAEAPIWLQDLVPAYASVGIFFDIRRITPTDALAWLTRRANAKGHKASTADEPARSFAIPCCYEMQLDMSRIAKQTGLDADGVIALHANRDYTVHAVGFCPGFPYLGYLPKKLQGMARLDTPRVRLEPGSVGLAGQQTGVYPLARPGGWNILGRTPLTLVDPDDGFFPIRVGDTVRFERIDEKRFGELLGERLTQSA